MKVPAISALFFVLTVLGLLWQDATATTVSTSDNQGVCTVKGRVYTNRRWYGYILNKAFHQNYAKIQYQITYPVKECCSNLLIYYDDQVKRLRSTMSCEERTAILPPDNNQIIPLRATNDSSGCTFWNETGEAFFVCRGERIFRSSVPRTWFFAISRCEYSGLFNLNYVFNITGYEGECEDDPLAPSSGWNTYINYLYSGARPSSNEKVYKILSISFGVLAGIALISTAVFFALWFMGWRKAAKTKGSSVTSSQATMTQDDIFYVNPSLSDREQAEYSQSGSENYYEVIPERRSYESINTGGMPNGGAHIRQFRTLHGSIGHHPHAHAHPHAHLHHPHAHGHFAGHLPQGKDPQNLRGVTYTFEDYPPPPYQPPKMMGISKHGHIPGHQHALSLTLGQQRQRPGLMTHAYHSAMVPTSAALNPTTLNAANHNPAGGNIIDARPSTSGTGFDSVIHPHGIANSSNIPISSGGGGVGMTSAPSSMATFGGPHSNINSSSNIPISMGGNGLSLSGMPSHQGVVGGNVSHSASHQPASTAGIAMPSLASAFSSATSHVPPPAPGQSETSA